EIHIDDGLWPISADATQINQLLMNLAVNARDAMPNGGTLAITAANDILDEIYAGMNPEAQPGEYMMLQVTDTGQGMTSDVIDRGFQPYLTTEEFGKVTVRGLSSTHAIVKLHGGLVTLYSEPGRGTCFHIYLPADASGDEVQSDARDPARLPLGNGVT